MAFFGHSSQSEAQTYKRVPHTEGEDIILIYGYNIMLVFVILWNIRKKMILSRYCLIKLICKHTMTHMYTLTTIHENNQFAKALEYQDTSLIVKQYFKQFSP